MSLATDALALAKLGLPVFPVKQDKAPLTPRGFKDATTEQATVRAWWKKWSTANIGIYTGRLAVLDPDGPEGEATLASLEAELGTLPATCEQRTPKGGRHKVYSLPEGVTVPSTARKLGPGLDTRGKGGYIATGKGYEWIRPPADGLAPLPAAWLDRLTGKHKPDSAPETRSKLAELLAEPPAEGERNNWLTALCGHLAKELKHRDAYDGLVFDNGRAVGLDDAEIKKTADSIWSKEHSKADTGAEYQLLSIEDLSKLAPPSWLIDGHVPESSFSTVYGPPGVGKSFLVLDWALSIAAGVEWVAYNVKQRPVLYITAEGVSGLYRRIQAWCADRKCEPPAGFFYALPEAVNLLDKGNVDLLRSTIASMPNPPGLIIADTLARMIEGGDENSAKDVGQAIAALTRVAKPYDAATMFVHHTSKEGDSERGSTALRGASDMMAALKPSGAGITLSCTKMKNWEEFNPFLLHLAKMADSCVFALGLPDGAEGDSEARFIEGVGLAFGTRWATAKEMEEVLELSKTTFFRTRKALLDKGILVAEDESKRYTRYRLTDGD